MKRLHAVIGIVAAALFAHSGYVMLSGFPGLYAQDVSARYLYRASHVYILLAALVNLMAGIYLSPHERRGPRITQIGGSALLILGTLVLVAAFYFEPKAGPERLVTSAGIALVLVGTLAHAGAAMAARARRRGERTD